jgi:hypothetical protein
VERALRLNLTVFSIGTGEPRPTSSTAVQDQESVSIQHEMVEYKGP